MKRRTILCLSICLGLPLVVLSVLESRDHVSYADAGILYVAPGGTCGRATPCYASVQEAVDAATAGDEIRVARGTYNEVTARDGVTETVYISKSVSIRGGYTRRVWTTPDPVANPTTLDAQGRGRVFYIEGPSSPRIEGLRIAGGDAKGQGGIWWG